MEANTSTASGKQTNGSEKLPIQHQQKGGKKMKYKVTIPVKLLAFGSKSPTENKRYIESYRKDALKMGATYMDFRVIGGMAEFESDNAQFVQGLHSMHYEIIEGLTELMKDIRVYSAPIE
jgi:hypothetical protein